MLHRILYCLFFLSACNRLSAAVIVVTAGVGGNFFSPAHFTINPGDTVQWIWKDGHHNTSSVSIPTGSTGWYANLNSADTGYLYVPAVSGLYRYTCTHHSAMDGSFFVKGCTYPSQPLIGSTWESDPCPGTATILLYTAPQAGASYQWIRSGITIPGANTDSLHTSVPGSYKVVVNRCGMDSVSRPFYLASYPLPAPSFTYSSLGLHYTFTNTTPAPSAGLLFRWHFGDSSPVFTGTHAEHTFSKSGTYLVRLWLSDSADHCADSTEQMLDIALDIGTTGKTGLLIQPNPAPTQLDIHCPIPCHAVLYDPYGRTALHSGVPGLQQHLELEKLPAGTYLLLLYDEKGHTFSKHIIVH